MNEQVKVGRPRKVQSELRSKNDARADLIRQERFSGYVSKSLQPCAVKDNRLVLKKLLQERTNPKKKQKIEGLLAVFDLLKSNHVAENGKEYDCSFVAFAMKQRKFFFAFQDKTPPFVNTDRDKFTYALPHKDWGLCVYIIYIKSLNKKFIILRLNSFGDEDFLNTICTENVEAKQEFDDKLVLNAVKVKKIFDTVDTEWDKKVARVMVCANRTRSQISKLGIDVNNVKTDINKVGILKISTNSVRLHMRQQLFLMDYLEATCRLLASLQQPFLKVGKE